MVYRIFNIARGEEEDGTQAHVFARAYHWAWCSMYGSGPAGRHEFPALQFTIDFGPEQAREGASQANAAPAARRVEPTFAPMDLPPVGRHDD
jgi:hypothetical protein